MKRNRTIVLTILSLFVFLANRAHASSELDFWRWFQKNQSSLFDFERDRERIFDKLSEEMHRVDPSLTFELGPKEGGRREFIISADGVRDAFPKVESLFAVAPSLPNWKFIKFRPRREPFDMEYAGVSVKASSVTVVMEPEGQRINIAVLIPDYTRAARETYLGIAFLLLDQALGEYDVETKVGYVDVQGTSPTNSPAIPLALLPSAFDALLSKKE